MGAPSYEDTYTRQASEAFDKALAEYGGKRGWGLATNQAQEAAGAGAANAGAAAAEAAGYANRSAGMTRGQAAANSANQSASAAAQSWNTLFDSTQARALQNNNNTIQAQIGKLSSAITRDTNIYNGKSNQWAGMMGGIGGLLTGAANTMSDETKKDVKGKIDVNDRCDELISRLRGETK